MPKCQEMETRLCPGKDCPALRCARFLRNENEWTADELANHEKRLARMVQFQQLSLRQRGI